MADQSKVNSLFDRYWEFTLESSPTFATFTGDKRFEDKLPDISEEKEAEYLGICNNFLNEIKAADKTKLSESEIISLKLLERVLIDRAERNKYKMWRWNVDHMEGEYEVLFDIQRYLNIKTEKDFENLVKRFKAYPLLVHQYISNLQKGKKDRNFAFEIAVKRTIEKLEDSLRSDLKSWMFGASEVKIINSSIYLAEIESLLKTSVRKSVEELVSFLKNEILPNARKTPGICALPDGNELYDYCIKYHTTTKYTAKELHEIGMNELKKNQNDVMKIADELGFKGTLKEFITHIENNPANYPVSKESYLDLFRQINDKINKKLPELFNNLPNLECVVKPTETSQEKNAPAAYYFPPPLDGSRPGIFYANTYDLPSRALYTAAALAAHEASPGHHLQCSYSVVVKDLPKFRRYYWATAFGEGWAHYAELLGDEIGIYDDKLSKVGMLFDQAWRAARLVVDTGIHAFGWGREQAIEFFENNLSIGHTDAVNEIDRYIIWPGQALAYKVGQLEFIRLRKYAKEKLGSKFDVRKFHYETLRHGTLPLNILQEIVERWIKQNI